MIDRDELRAVLDRCGAALAGLEGVDDLRRDVEWLGAEVERLADDNDRLARLVADITTMVDAAKRRRLTPITDSIDAKLTRKRGGDN